MKEVKLRTNFKIEKMISSKEFPFIANKKLLAERIAGSKYLKESSKLI